MKERQGCIYMLTNLLNGKRYVGKDVTGDPEKNRWKVHIKSALEKNSAYPIHRAIRKASKADASLKNFAFEIIWVGAVEKLNAMEISLIKKHHSFADDPLGDCSYNLTPGGDGITTWPKYLRNKLRVAQLQRYEDPAERAKLSELGKRRFSDPAEKAAHVARICKAYENPKVRQKISKAVLRAYARDSTFRERLSAVHKGVKYSERAKKNMSDAQYRRYEDPMEHAKSCEAQHYRWRDPMECQRGSEAQLRRYKDPMERQKQSRIKSPEERRKISKSWVRRRKDPQMHQKMSEATLRGWETRRNNQKIGTK